MMYAGTMVPRFGFVTRNGEPVAIPDLRGVNIKGERVGDCAVINAAGR